MVLTRRPVTLADFDATLAIKKEALGQYIAQVWGWDDEIQRQYHQSHYHPGNIVLLLCDGQSAGFLETADIPDSLSIINLLLLPKFQSRGIGTQVLKQLLQQAATAGQVVYLEVLKVNIRAYNLYHRLGFVIRDTSELKVRMVYSPYHEVR